MAGKKTVKKENVVAVEPVVKKEEEKIVNTAEKASAASVAPAETKKVEAMKAVKAVKAEERPKKAASESTKKKENKPKKAAPKPVKKEEPVKAEPKKEPVLPEPRRSVAFIGSECYPFVKTGGLGDVMYALPKALIPQNCDVRVIIPSYK